MESETKFSWERPTLEIIHLSVVLLPSPWQIIHKLNAGGHCVLLKMKVIFRKRFLFCDLYLSIFTIQRIWEKKTISHKSLDEGFKKEICQ